MAGVTSGWLTDGTFGTMRRGLHNFGSSHVKRLPKEDCNKTKPSRHGEIVVVRWSEREKATANRQNDDFAENVYCEDQDAEILGDGRSDLNALFPL